MTSQPETATFALRSFAESGLPDAAWWPQSRRLDEQLQHLFALWPDSAGRIARVLYSPPDWDDRPRQVAMSGRTAVKTGCFPRDDTHQLILTLLNGERRVVTVIPPDTPPADAKRIIDEINSAS